MEIIDSKELLNKAIKPRKSDSKKGDNGIALVVGGSWLYHGAPTLAALAALRSGIDLVYLATPKNIAPSIRAISPNLIVLPLPDAKLTKGSARRLIKWLPKKVDSSVIGPGLGKQNTDGMKLLVDELSMSKIKILLDADALQLDVIERLKGKDCVITPHAGEFKRVFNIELKGNYEDKAIMVKEKAKEYNIIVLLKGKYDIISDGERVVINKTGCSAMTVGGTGDVLAGLVAGLMAKGIEPFIASVFGAYINGIAGERAYQKLGLHIMATDLIDELPFILKPFDRVEE
ncbi:MAG: NAD(P)H-hydrate dehydratase [Nitrososphaerales archaeon]